MPLPQPVLDDLGRVWLTHRNRRWLFPNRHGDAPLNRRTLSGSFADAAVAACLPSGATPHTLRHSYATRLLEHDLHPPDHADPGVTAGLARPPDDRPLTEAVMIEIADVFRRFAADYLDAHGAAMPPSHRRAIADISTSTAGLGGEVWRCDECGVETFSYHSCGNRSCPKCHTAQTREWLEHRQAEMLPVPYFHITVTVPAEVGGPLRAHQRDGYAALIGKEAAISRSRNRVRCGTSPCSGLHTWESEVDQPRQRKAAAASPRTAPPGTRPAAASCCRSRRSPQGARQGPGAAAPAVPDLVVPDAVWHTDWIAHVTAWGQGEQAVLDYLARYVFRIAIKKKARSPRARCGRASRVRRKVSLRRQNS